MRVWIVGMSCLSALACAHDEGPQPAAKAPENISREEACRRWKCRPASTLRLRDKQGIFEKDLTPTPYTDGELVQIMPGESFAISGDVEGGRLVRLRLAEGMAAEHDALVLTFKQEDLGGTPAMILKVENRFPGNLKYSAGMVVPGHKGLPHTSSCPVLAGKSTYETWPHPIIALVLRDLVFLPPQAPHRCD